MADVFISHSSIDKAIADKLCEELEARGLKCWIAPRDIAAGSEWAAAISEAISETKVMLLIYSHNSAQSTQVPKEINLAESWGKVIIPYKIDDAQLAGVFAYFLAGAHWILANPAKEDYRVDELYDDITDKIHASNTPVQNGTIVIENLVAEKKKGSKALFGLVCGIGVLIVTLLVVMIIMLNGKLGNENGREEDKSSSKKQKELMSEETPEPEITEEPGDTEENAATSAEYFEYTVTNGEVTITEYVGNEESVVIPAEIDGTPVTAIGERAFYGCTGLKQVDIPDSVTTIEKWAFEESGLTSIVIPDSVVEVGAEAFICCTDLTKATLPGNLKSLEANVFYGCTSLASVTLPEQLKIIEMGVFRETGLRKIVIPDSVTYIGESAFSGCTELRSITLPTGITEITPFMLQGCSNLTSVDIPQNVTIIGRAAFSHSGLETIMVPENVVFMENSVFYGCVNLEFAYISTKINYIPEYTFCGCSSFVGITMSPNVEMIGEWAFHNTNFTELPMDLFPIKEIGRGAFSNCLSLEKVTLPDTLVKISEEAFRYSPNLTEISIPAGVKGCAADAFSDNWEVTITYGDVQYALLDNGLLSDELYGLLNTSQDFEYTIAGEEAIITQYVGTDTVVVVPEKIDGVYVTAIGDEVFADREDIEFVTMFRGVKSIGNSAFESCVNLRMVDLSSELVSIGKSAFESCNSLECVELSLTLTEIGSRAFAETALIYVTVPRGVASINYGTFYGCEQLTGIYLEDGIVRIEDFAFGKTALETVTIPYTVTELASNAFLDCNELSIIYKFVRYFYSGGDLSELFNSGNSDDYI